MCCLEENNGDFLLCSVSVSIIYLLIKHRLNWFAHARRTVKPIYFSLFTKFEIEKERSCKSLFWRQSKTKWCIQHASPYLDDLLFLLCCNFLKIVLIFFLLFPLTPWSLSSCSPSAFSLLSSFSSRSLPSPGWLASLVKDSWLPRLDTGSANLDLSSLLIESAVWEIDNTL